MSFSHPLEFNIIWHTYREHCGIIIESLFYSHNREPLGNFLTLIERNEPNHPASAMIRGILPHYSKAIALCIHKSGEYGTVICIPLVFGTGFKVIGQTFLFGKIV